MKKLINDPRSVVREMLEGYADLNPGTAILENENVIVKAGLPAPAERQVAVLSGGGSGHEPAHAGYVGDGMLTAAIAGDVFTSPSADAVLAAIRVAAGPRGAVLIVKNYTGDRLNFGIAAELATAEGIPTKVVVVADDASLRHQVARERWRGIAGTVLVHKIAGAAAASGANLDDVIAAAQAASSAVVTMGVGIGACTVPAAGKPGFSIGDMEMELGLGIHGERGVSRVPLQPVDAIVDEILDVLVSERNLVSGSKVALLVNGLGGTPPMELAIAARHALRYLRGLGIIVERAWCGNFVTALEMPGFSLTLLPVDARRLEGLDAPVSAPAWPGEGRLARRKVIGAIQDTPSLAAIELGPLSASLRTLMLRVAHALEKAEASLTDLDSRTGDGDLGVSMTRGAAAIRTMPEASFATPATTLRALSQVLRRTIAGSSGPFYAAALLRGAGVLGDSNPDAARWSHAFTSAVASIGELGGAKPGYRTMLDALDPAARVFSEQVQGGRSLAEAWRAATEAACSGAVATADMLPRLGRAAYLGERVLGVQDGGAVAVTIWMRALLSLEDNPRDL